MCLEKQKGISEHIHVFSPSVINYQNSGKKPNIFIGFYEISQNNIPTIILYNDNEETISFFN